MRILLLAAPLLPLAQGAATPSAHPVCIVGAGVSGLTAAKALEDKGYKTVLFEKRSTVGGKCQSHYEDGNFFPLGAVLFTQSPSYAQTFKVITSTGAAYEKFGSTFGWDFDPKTGVAAERQPLSVQTVQALQAELIRYSDVWQKTFAPIGVPGYKNGVPKEFAVSTKQWLLTNNFPIIASVINRAAGNYGYGDYTQVPALYHLQFFAPDIVGSFIGTVQPYTTDFFDVFTRVSKTIKGPIHLGVDIQEICRDSSPTIRYRASPKGSIKSQRCSHLIMAFPPTSKALRKSGLQLSPAENALFSKVGTNNYFASAVRMKQLPSNVTLVQSLPDPLSPFVPQGQPVYVTDLHANSNIASVYSADEPGAPGAEERVKRRLITDLSKVNRNVYIAQQASLPVTPRDVRAFSGQVDYFPHLGTDAVAGGWYKRFNGLQGTKHTYFTSGLNSFELVEYTIRAAQDLVATYF